MQRAIRPPFLPRACRAGRGRLRASPGSSLDRAGLPTGSFRAPLDSEPLPSGAARSSGILATARRWDPVRVTRTSESLGQCSRRGPRPGPGRGGRRNGRGRGLEKRLGRRLSKRLRKPPDTFTGRGPSAGAARAPRTPSSSGPDPDQSGPGQRPGSAAQCSAHHALAACAASVAKAPDALASHRRVPSHCSAACGESTLHVRAPGFPSHYPSRAVLSPVRASRLCHPARRQGSSSIFRVSSSLSDPNPHGRGRAVAAACGTGGRCPLGRSWTTAVLYCSTELQLSDVKVRYVKVRLQLSDVKLTRRKYNLYNFVLNDLEKLDF